MSCDAVAAAVSADADVHTDRRLNAVVAVNSADVFGAAVFFHAVVIINRRAVDALALHLGGVDGRIIRGGECSPRHCNSFASCARGRSRARTARCAGDVVAAIGFENGVSHAARLTIENDVFDDADFGAVCAADLRADDLATLNVAGRAARR